MYLLSTTDRCDCAYLGFKNLQLVQQQLCILLFSLDETVSEALKLIN